MKPNFFTLTVLTLAGLAVCPVLAQDKPEGKGDLLEYASEDDYKTIVESGALKLDTFYWRNRASDPALSPTPKMDGDTPYLEMPGGKGNRPVSSDVDRFFQIPEGKTTAHVSLEMMVSSDLWTPFAPGIGSKGEVLALFSDGKRLGGGHSLASSLPKAGWQTVARSLPLTPGATLFGLSFKVPHGLSVGIRKLDISFE